MKINVDRLAVLAGIPSNTRSRVISEGYPKEEGAGHDKEMHEDMSDQEVADMYNEVEDSDEMAMAYERSHDHDEGEQVVEIDEVMLVQELRRAKKLMSESRNQKRQEQQLQRIIEEEVENIFGDLNLNSSWVYGGNKPQRSKKGYTHQGS
jgi:hypothetical protein